MSVISIRVDKELKEALDEIAKLKKMDKTTFIKQRLPEMILQARIETAVDAYQKGATAENAAATASIDLWTFLDALREKNILHHPHSEGLYLAFLQKHQKNEKT